MARFYLTLTEGWLAQVLSYGFFELLKGFNILSDLSNLGIRSCQTLCFKLNQIKLKASKILIRMQFEILCQQFHNTLHEHRRGGVEN